MSVTVIVQQIHTGVIGYTRTAGSGWRVFDLCCHVVLFVFVFVFVFVVSRVGITSTRGREKRSNDKHEEAGMGVG